jgi:glycosyltransferase involved in cell wall biosynthesis
MQDSERLKLGIVFYFSSSWMGGVNYIINVVRMLNFLDDENKPDITLFYNTELKKFINEINYPYLKLVERQFPSVFMGYFRSWISGKNVFVNDIINNYDIDGLYPIHDFPVKTTSKTKLVSWYADLQHKYYPEFFSKLKIFERNARIKLILKNSDHLVVSSLTVADDFRKFFRIRPDMEMHIFHFGSVIDDLSNISIEELLIKYNLPSEYFIVSNQFYKHKNHRILLNALADLKKKGKTVQLALTGKLPENDGSPYIKELYAIIDINQLHNQIRFLGVLPRKEQLLLMKYSQAVIQPSLFEGWSTVIEDAISLQVPVIAANIQVNVEQLGKSGVYFNPANPSELSTILSDYPTRNMENVIYEDYSRRIKRVAHEFISIFS